MTGVGPQALLRILQGSAAHVVEALGDLRIAAPWEESAIDRSWSRLVEFDGSAERPFEPYVSGAEDVTPLADTWPDKDTGQWLAAVAGERLTEDDDETPRRFASAEEARAACDEQLGSGWVLR